MVPSFPSFALRSQINSARRYFGRLPSASEAAMRKETGPLLICNVSSFKEIFYEGNDLHGLIGVCGVNSIG